MDSSDSSSVPKTSPDTWSQDDAPSGFLEDCICGALMEIESIPRGPFAGRLQYVCTKAEDGEFHTWKFWDTAVEQEIRKIRREFKVLQDTVHWLTHTPGGEFISPVREARRIDSVHAEILKLKKDIEDLGHRQVENTTLIYGSIHGPHRSPPSTQEANFYKNNVGLCVLAILLLLASLIGNILSWFR